MVASRRKTTQKSKRLGSRFFGRGNVKNRRGSGNRGGRGNAGLHKHKFTWITVNDPDYFGKHGFHRPPGLRVKMPVVHLYDIDRKAVLDQLEKKDGKFAFSFEGKVLSTGKINHAVVIKALAWSKNCEEKVKKVGGEISKIA